MGVICVKMVPKHVTGNRIRPVPLQRYLSTTSANASKHSYVHGTSNTSLLNDTIGEVLHRQVERLPNKELFIFPHQQIRKTYEQFYNDVRKLASGLLAIGFERGDRIGIWAPNIYEWALTQFAAAVAGLVLVNINPAYKSSELEYCLRKVEVKGVIAIPSFKTQNYYAMFQEIMPQFGRKMSIEPINDQRFPHLKHVILTGSTRMNGAWLLDDVLSMADSSSDEKLNEITSLISSEEPANIQFTSGTTGSPKGATLSHHNVVNNAYFAGMRIGYDKYKSIICCPPPLYHCFGCVAGTLMAVVHGATTVFPAAGVDPLATLENVDKEKCTSLYGTPTMFIDVLHHPRFSDFNVTSLRTGVIAGAPCPTEICNQMISKLHMKHFTIVYGTTENSPVTFQTKATDSIDVRTKTVGSVLDHVEAKVVGEDGRAVKRGQCGELWTRGFMVMRGYWNDPEKTAETISADRWYRTGDLAVMDEHGHVSIIGRLKDMVIRGGENIYPTEIEQFLHKHPKVADVQVVGVPDERLGEELCAWIRLRDGETATADEIKEYCKGQIARFKVPRYIQFKTQAEFPVTVTGKVQKFRMREIAKKELGLDNIKTHWSDSGS